MIPVPRCPFWDCLAVRSCGARQGNAHLTFPLRGRRGGGESDLWDYPQYLRTSCVHRACNLMGATSGTAIMLILPGLFYVKLHQDQVPNSGWQQAVGWFMAVMGVPILL